MTTIFPADACAPAVHIPPPPPRFKTTREVEIEQLLRECLPFVLVDPWPTEKTYALIDRVAKVIG